MSRTPGHQSALARYIRNRYAALPGSMRSDSIGVPAIRSSIPFNPSADPSSIPTSAGPHLKVE